MTIQDQNLNLLVIDGDQRYAERLVSLLSAYYSKVNLGFLDDKNELLKSLRHQWDVLVFGQAYDMRFTDVVGIIEEQAIDLPMICLMSDEMASSGRNSEDLPAIIDGEMIKALQIEDEAQVVMAICLAHDHLKTRRQLSSLRLVLEEAEQRANILIKNSKSAVAYFDEGVHIFANDPYIELFGFETMEEIIGVPVIDLIAGGDNVKGFKQFLRRFDKGNRDQVEFEFESRRKDGSTFEATLQLAAATFDGMPVKQIIIQQNPESSAQIAKQLAEAQRRDSLTGLSNRHGFEAKLDQLYNQVIRGDNRAALLYIRLDDIGKINSSLGLKGVDTVVKQVAYHLDEYFESGFVSRFGDTTFTVLLEALSEAQLYEAAEDIRAKIGDLLIEVGQRSTSTTVSIGMVMMDKNSPEKPMLIERAIDAIDQVMLKTNESGNGTHLYDPSQHANSDDEALAEYLVKAISQNRFELLYQPIYDIKTDRSDFFEVYIQLRLADGTLMTPDQFMGVAKKHQLLEKIDRWILINACKHLSSVRKQYPNSRLLVRLSSASLEDSKLSHVISQLLKAVGGDSGALTVQFSEQDIVDYMAIAKKQFLALSKVHCGLSIHNFGMTTKSMDAAEYVKPDMARLAQSYVGSLSDDESVQTVKTLVTKAEDHGFSVLMPYIVDAATMSVAWSVGARYLQGDYLQAPAKMMISAKDNES